MPLPGIHFLGAETPYSSSRSVVLGVPFDLTTTFRPGARAAPNSVREASFHFESYLLEHDLDLGDISLHDMGNLPDHATVEEMVDGTRAAAKTLVSDGKFPVILGGEHTITVPAVEAFEDIGVIFIDAHLNYNDTARGGRYNHDTVTRRVAEHVGKDNVLVFGVRSFSRGEHAEGGLPEYIDAFSIAQEGVEKAFKRALNIIKKDKIYLSLDVDGIDPAFAPAASMPEPFGLTSLDVKKCINLLGPRLVGFDVVEISPPYDKGNTAALGARMVQEALAVAWKYRKGEKEQAAPRPFWKRERP
ncbi:MAG: agmatinase [Methanomassiliicoccus sp.]|nr:agmatinase [Methanomassiliicoccus sp.]